MATVADLPASARIMANPAGNGGFEGGESGTERQESVTWAVNWEDRAAFEAAVRGFPVTVTVGTTTLTRRVPLECPYSTLLYANAFRWRAYGKTDTSKVRPYRTMIYQVTFGVFPYNTTGDSAYQKIQATGSTRQITIPERKYVFSNGEIVDHGVAVNWPGTSYVFTLFQIPDVAAFDNAMIELMATPVNDAPLVIAGRTFPTGTILLETYSYDYSKSGFGIVETTANVVLLYSSLPWNKMQRSDGVVDTLSPLSYNPGDLSVLVQ